MQSIINTIASYFNFVIAFLTDSVQSVKDFILDLPVILLKAATQLITWLLDKVSSYCSYCLGGTTPGTVGISKFAEAMQDAYDALGPCVVYALSKSALVGDLQLLSCAMVVWSAMRLVSLVKIVRG